MMVIEISHTHGNTMSSMLINTVHVTKGMRISIPLMDQQLERNGIRVRAMILPSRIKPLIVSHLDCEDHAQCGTCSQLVRRPLHQSFVLLKFE